MKVLTLFLCLGAVSLFGQTCATFRTIAPSATVQGRLDESQCLLSDGSIEESYRITVPRRGVLRLEIVSATPGFVVYLRDSSGFRIASGAKFEQHLESGLYTIVANSAKPGDIDDYKLTTDFLPDAEDICHYTPLIEAGSFENPNAVAYQLNESSCSLPDGTRAESYRVTVFGSGTLNLTVTSDLFSPQLVLRGEDGYFLASADAGGGNQAGISTPVSGNQTYTIVVFGTDRNNSTGATKGVFTLAIGFAPDDDPGCRVAGAFSGSQDLDGLFDNTSCTFILPGRDDAALFKFFDVEIPSQGIAQFRLANASFGGYLLLVDAQGNSISDDRNSGNGGIAQIRQQVPAGKYRVYVFNGDSFEGSYTLSYVFAAGNPAICSPLVFTPSQSAAGSLSGNSSCRRRDMMSDEYRIDLTDDSQIGIAASSGDFTTWLGLRDAKDNLLVIGEQTIDGYSSQLSTQLPAGTYYAVIGSEDLSGGYTVSYSKAPRPMPACDAPIVVALNTGYINLFGRNNCVTSDGRTTDLYEFTLPADGMTALVLTSAAIEGILSLLDSTGKLIRWNRGGYVGNNPAIFQYLTAGTYRLQVRAVTPSTGKYRVDVLYTGGPLPSFCGAAPLSLNSSIAGVLDYPSCRYPDDTFAQWYRFDLSVDTTVRVEIDSVGFVPGLVVFDGKGNLLGSADAASAGTAKTQLSLAPGTYFVVAKASDDAKATGGFTLIVLSDPSQ